MSGPHLSDNWKDWSSELRNAVRALPEKLQDKCSEIARSVKGMFDEQPSQKRILAAHLNNFELDQPERGGFASYLQADPKRLEFVEKSALTWSKPDDLRAAALAGWQEAIRALEPRVESRFGKRWTKAQVPYVCASSEISEAVFSGAGPAGTLFGIDFETMGTMSVGALQSAFRNFIGQPNQGKRQREYWMAKPLPVEAITVRRSWIERLPVWVRKLFGMKALPRAQCFSKGEVHLDSLPRSSQIHDALWDCEARRNTEAARLNEDMKAWQREFGLAESAMGGFGTRHAEILQSSSRAVSEEGVAAALVRTKELRSELDETADALQKLGAQDAAFGT